MRSVTRQINKNQITGCLYRLLINLKWNINILIIFDWQWKIIIIILTHTHISHLFLFCAAVDRHRSF